MAEDVAAFIEADRTIHTQRIIPIRVALTAEQIVTYGLPTAPPKPTDSRSKRWRGETCQAEALSPDALAAIVRDALVGRFDRSRLAREIKREEADRAELLLGLPAANGRG
jgi:hypothetical protein